MYAYSSTWYFEMSNTEHFRNSEDLYQPETIIMSRPTVPMCMSLLFFYALHI